MSSPLVETWRIINRITRYVFVGYLVVYESYHHGEMGVILAQQGHRLRHVGVGKR